MKYINAAIKTGMIASVVLGLILIIVLSEKLQKSRVITNKALAQTDRAVKQSFEYKELLEQVIDKCGKQL